MIDIILLGVIAGLYVLGKWQGGAVLEAANAYLLEEGQEPMEGAEAVLMTWGWPIATVIAMVMEAKDGMDGK
jgi:hypothetical protein